MNPFIFHVPTRVYFGENQLSHLGRELSIHGKRVLLCYGGGSIKKIGLYEKIVAEIKAAGLELFELSGIEPNPRISSVAAGAAICKKENIDVLLAVGGGSAIDCAKGISVATFYDGDPWDIYTHKATVEKGLPLVTVVTIAATGTEMNVASVISNPETKDKLGGFFPATLPKASFLNPVDTYSVNSYLTACGSADILSHIMEMYFASEADLQMLDGVMESFMKTVMHYAPIAMKEPKNYEARANLMWVSPWTLNGFTSGGKPVKWSCHQMEHELSAIYDITHGLGLAILTPRWMEYILDENTVSKFYQYGVQVFGLDPDADPMEVAKKSIELTSQFFFDTLGLDDTFTKIGIDATHFPIMAKKACGNGILNGFKPLNQKDIEAIFRMCL